MNDLWPDFDDIEQDDNNNSLNIIEEQAEILGKKTNNKVKAIFSIMRYANNFNAVNIVTSCSTLFADKKTELLDKELENKLDVEKMLENSNYKFEIYTEKYRFRIFKYEYNLLYPNELILDENIAKELEIKYQIKIDDNQQLIELLRDIFSTRFMRNVLKLMIVNNR